MKALTPIELRRQSLLPAWVRFFYWLSWIPAVLSVGCLVFFVYQIISSALQSGNFVESLKAMLFVWFWNFIPIILIFLIFVSLLSISLVIIVGFGLLRGKRWSIYLGIIQGLIGLLFSAVLIRNGGFNIISVVILLVSILCILIIFKIISKWLSAGLLTKTEIIEEIIPQNDSTR